MKIKVHADPDAVAHKAAAIIAAEARDAVVARGRFLLVVEGTLLRGPSHVRATKGPGTGLGSGSGGRPFQRCRPGSVEAGLRLRARTKSPGSRPKLFGEGRKLALPG